MVSCDKHPKYKGKKKPTNGCADCLKLYLLLHNKPRTPIPPTRVMRDKSKYTRKTKHKKDEDA